MTFATGPDLGVTCPYYGGRQSNVPAYLIHGAAAPTSAQYQYALGTLWIVKGTGFLYYLASKTATSAVWSLLQSTDSAYFGTGTLVAGVATIAATGVATGSDIILSRTTPNASTALGALTYGTITAGTSFVVTSLQPASPTMTQTGDVSSFVWWIVT
jgi:hypothetical protein